MRDETPKIQATLAKPTDKLLHLIIVLFILILTLVSFFAYKRMNKPSEEVHHHAAFKVIKKGELIDFSGLEYMYLGSCGEIRESKEVQDKIHLHDRRGDIAHIHSEGVTWNDLFKSIDYELPDGTQVIVNGKDTSVSLETEIKNSDRALFIIEEEFAQEQMDSLPSVEEIKEVAEKGENCGV